MKNKIFLILLCASLPIMRCANLAGGSTETTNVNISAKLLNPGGTPARNAAIHFYHRNYNPEAPALAKTSGIADSTTTDKNGVYAITLDTGAYSMVAVGDSGMAYRDSVWANQPACTLRTPGALKGSIMLECGGDVRSVLILFLGTHFFTTPDDSTGAFSTESMPAGRYRTRIMTTTSDYEIKDTIFTIQSGKKSDMKDTIRLVCKGLAAPGNLSGSYDTLHGVATLTWSRVNYAGLSGYVVFRYDTTSVIPTRLNDYPITDTVFKDTLLSDLTSTATLVYTYRVKSVEKNSLLSKQYSNPVTLYAPSPGAMLNKVTAISAGGAFSLFLKGNGTLWACGLNNFGQLGDGTTNNRFRPFMVMSNVRKIASGQVHSLILKTDNTLWACGGNSIGQLGTGDTAPRFSPVKISDNVQEMAASGYLSLIIHTDASLWMCGADLSDTGENIGSILTPKSIMTNVRSASAGGIVPIRSFSLIVKTDNTLWAYGSNNFGALGAGAMVHVQKPTQIMTDVQSVSAGDYAHSLIVKNDNTLWGCGQNGDGQLGNGSTTVVFTDPIQVMAGVRNASAGGYSDYSLIIKTDNSLWACGLNNVGQLGDGTTAQRRIPVKIMTDVSDAQAGDLSSIGISDHSLILKTDGTVWGCGSNTYGQLGDSILSNRSIPVQIMFPSH